MQGQPNDGFCQCGCGQRTSLAPRNDRRKGWLKGQPVRYVRGHYLKSALGREAVRTVQTGRKHTVEHRAKIAAAQTETGHARRGRPSRTYNTWRGMVDRCTNPNTAAYRYYGALGVTVCERWLTFANFLADMGERPGGLTLDRIDPYGNYEPSNCRWATPQVQATNRRRRPVI